MTKKYIPEIQGLRTLAALLVAVYHIWFGRVSGGVDVFFVVSAFFIAMSFSKYEKVNLKIIIDYYYNTFRRVIPSAAIVYTFTCIMIYLFWPKLLWSSEIKHSVATLLNVENWYLAFSETDYLNDGIAKSPFQQFWALSLQIQFYLLFPLFILIHSLFLKKSQGKNPTLIFTFLFISSLTYSVYITLKAPEWAYFDSFARAWEFCFGFLLFYFLSNLNINRWLATVLNFVACCGILVFGYFVDISNSFPGYMALCPVILAGIVIITSKIPGVYSVLQWKPLISFGNYSFAFYLWHWPFLMFAKLHSDTINIPLGLGIILISGLLAVITTKFIENPIRTNLGLVSSYKKSTFLLGGIISCMGGFCLFLIISFLLAQNQGLQTLSKIRKNFLIPPNSNISYTPESIVVRKDIPRNYADGCHQNEEDTQLLKCSYGNETSSKKIIIVGGSHAAQWLHPLIKFAEKYDYELVSLTKSACSFVLYKDPLYSPSQSCLDWNNYAFKEIIELNPEFVITTFSRNSKHGEYVPEGYMGMWSKLHEKDIPVVAIRDNPWFSFDPPLCVEQNEQSWFTNCSIPREEFYNDIEIRKAMKLTSVTIMDFSSFFCPGDICVPVNEQGILIYRDKHHITTTYAISLTEEIFEFLQHFKLKIL